MSSNIAKDLLDEVNEHANDRRASVRFFQEMGYERSGRKVQLRLEKTDGGGNVHLTLYELRDIDKPEREVPFSYLYDTEMQDGVVMPTPFSKYTKLQKRTKVALSES